VQVQQTELAYKPCGAACIFATIGIADPDHAGGESMIANQLSFIKPTAIVGTD